MNPIIIMITIIIIITIIIMIIDAAHLVLYARELCLGQQQNVVAIG